MRHRPLSGAKEREDELNTKDVQETSFGGDRKNHLLDQVYDFNYHQRQ